jgi:hypothetical protein
MSIEEREAIKLSEVILCCGNLSAIEHHSTDPALLARAASEHPALLKHGVA